MSERYQLDEVVPPALARLPISAPVWLWGLYALVLLLLGAMAGGGGLEGFVAVLFAAGFSFQFWSFAIHRGLRRSALARRPSP